MGSLAPYRTLSSAPLLVSNRAIAYEPFVRLLPISSEAGDVPFGRKPQGMPVEGQHPSFGAVCVGDEKVSALSHDRGKALRQTWNISGVERFLAVLSKYPPGGNRVRRVEIDEISGLHSL